ncbi:MAG: NAD-dependent deacylase [Gemmatimonadales bacterium]|nr:MAG: NAD-dependent deacylase [Gemmatimonadales bacterium]
MTPGSVDDPVRALREAIAAARGILIVTGAGVSAESGVPTFRGEGGLWKRRRVEDLATPGAFRRDPRTVWEWYAERREAIGRCTPNAAHRAIAALLLRRSDVTVVTQNVDGLHDRAIIEAGEELPHPRLIHLHGSLFTLRCVSCPWQEPHSAAPIDPSSEVSLPRCPACGAMARPGVVWFGEPLPEAALREASIAATAAELCLVVGTSAVVYPAASIPQVAVEAGARLAEFNPSPTPLTPLATWIFRQAAGKILPYIIHEVE